MEHAGFHAKRILQLALPVLIAQVTQTLMGFIDTVMAGRVSAADMAAVAVGTSIWLPAILFFQGMLMAITPLMSHHHGANESNKIGPLAIQASYIAIVGGALVMLILHFSNLLIAQMQLEPALEQISTDYISAILWGAPGMLLYQVVRSCGEGISYTKPAMFIGFIGLAINIPANFIFIYGYFGIPAMGGAGCGVATAIVFWAMFVSMLLYIFFHKRFDEIQLFNHLAKPNWKSIFGLVRIGLPVALALFFEVSIFAVIALLLAPLGADVVASHQIALNFSSIVFMVPLSIGVAVSIRVGYYLGRHQPAQSALVAKTGIGLGLALAACTAVITVVFREQIAMLYNDSPQVISLASGLMLMAAVYQLSDSVQVISSGALRGFKDTKSAFYITLIAYWVIGMPVGYTLASTDVIVEPLGAYGFWTGLIAGLTSAAIMFSIRLRIIKRRALALRTSIG
ncbi:MATE family efflux transporter [Shewanella avicenniae]|uniref:Multidrug-efflux transporter n=1 Tax=Shewanella avicenniae TaxID=2814294 RepID=A0ABX7QWC5_9GAMM|nr:MATE family efflux transporter [Shewanella avicenniae]QSX35332.1 MATE family efflux transporter [Shewanella avicenniae]